MRKKRRIKEDNNRKLLVEAKKRLVALEAQLLLVTLRREMNRGS